MKRYNEGWDIKEASPDYWEWVAQMEVGQEGGQLQSTHLDLTRRHLKPTTATTPTLTNWEKSRWTYSKPQFSNIKEAFTEEGLSRSKQYS